MYIAIATARDGHPGFNVLSLEREAYFRATARPFKKEVDLPLILIGGIRSFDVADSARGG